MYSITFGLNIYYNITVKHTRLSLVILAEIFPLCISTIDFAIERPIP